MRSRFLWRNRSRRLCSIAAQISGLVFGSTSGAMDFPLYVYLLARSRPAQRSSREDAPYRRPTDLQPAGYLGFADTAPVQFPDFRSVDDGGRRPTQPFPVLPRMCHARPRSFAQNLPFEL